MPVYEYECNICSKRFDVKRGFNDESIAQCPQCNGKAHRLFSAVPIIFNGSGFYVTDNRRNGSGIKKTGNAAPSTEAVDSEK